MTQTVNMQRAVTSNGFKTKYDGPRFPASVSNQITYECFCFMGGLENDRLCKILKRNGSHTYYTYHMIDSP
jgi:hypothetical protein